LGLLTSGSDEPMGVDQGPVVQSAILRGELVRLRKENKLTQEEVARALEWSPSKLIRIEGGHSAITKVDLDALLTQYEVMSPDERARLQELNRGARSQRWWSAYRSNIAPEYLRYVGYEAGASSIRQFPGLVVPGLLQTREYAEALTRDAAEAGLVEPVVNLRMQRQAELAQRDNPPHRIYVLDEAVIRRRVGATVNRNIMPDQLRFIADTAARDKHTSVRLVPFDAGALPGLSGPFTLLEFDGDVPDRVYLDPGRGELANTDTNEETVSEYTSNFATLLELALPEDESIDFIRNVAEEMAL
jgi:transcriptional regulator with XRE-family HTH domain